MTKHTPTPWMYSEVLGGCFVRAGDREVLSYKHSPDAVNRANAAHIVRCVNAWDDAGALRARLTELEARHAG